eukprot:TRINITY_DN8147_c0_g1_i2.p1 TRINITY_DN8147_c0_g1~~TRINITY_DN8147_c0_g1_i2.p1  ORF type:complete len:416 (+),score=71.89 TRINITY_DN8147_c0_g1_i2:28-1275(+)
MSLTTKDLEDLKADLKCKICAFLMEKPVVLPCGHVFCEACTRENLNSSSKCPLCRAKYTRRSFYPMKPIAELCELLMDLGETLGITDISATQVSQVMPFKPFVPLQHPDKKPGYGGVLFSQNLREVKSQKPGEVSDSESSDEDEEEEEEDEQETHRHIFKRGCRKNWQCANISKGSCPKLKKQQIKSKREVFYCTNKPCRELLCADCYEKHEGLTKQASTATTETTEESDSDSDSQDEQVRKCVLCEMPEENQLNACRNLLSSVKKKDPSLGSGILWKNDATVMNKTLKGLEGPFAVTWNTGYKYRSIKQTEKRVREVYAHDLCLLWSPQTKFKGETSRVCPRSVPPAVRNAQNRRCSACGHWGASLKCRKSGCKKAFHIPCGLFTSSIGDINEQTFTVCCSQHASTASGRKRKR